jgi:hypothetical protein
MTMNNDQANQPITEAVETAAAVPTDLAWSREADTADLASRRDWRGALRGPQRRRRQPRSQ